MIQNPRTIFRLAMASLLVMLVWPRVVGPFLKLGTDWSDGLRGLFLGLTIGLLFVSMRLKSRGQREQRP
ncbi:MAG TPA: hypothetical protein VFV19_08140 [Candidatus Polarisedimenticolaceae bacterium]|nr:hypothetical protein [Candidatus Polarisedimenticolaceae bacterium]